VAFEDVSASVYFHIEIPPLKRGYVYSSKRNASAQRYSRSHGYTVDMDREHER
jgi:hypothetical protein